MQSPILSHPQVEVVALSALAPNPSNVRTHSDEQVGLIGASIDNFGWLVPLVVDHNNSRPRPLARCEAHGSQ
jgi:ParB-like chromosome segregation protein Spo0J